MMMKFSFILFAIFHLSLQNSSQEQDQQNLQVNQQRKLQSCSSTCSECDESGFCLKCSNQRVLPSCDCQIGYYDFQGTCQPCKKGCMSCTSGNDCQQCYLTYNLDVTNQICTCNISNMVDDCEKPKQGFLLQYSRYMSDFRSIELVFNEMINIVGKELYEQFNPLSSTNCDILDSQTKSIYLNSVFTCFIDSLQRNRFIITFCPQNFIQGSLDHQQEVIDLAGTTVSQQNIVYLNYNIQRVPDLDNQMNNINPQNDLWIEIDKTQILLAESRNIDSKFVSQSWFCVDKNDEPCMNANQQPLQILQLGNKMRLQSIKYQFSQQFQKFSVDTGQTYAYADIQGQQTGGIINVQDFISISIFIHTDFPYQIKQALYKLNLEQNGLIKTLTSNSNQFSFQIQDYFPNPNFAQKPAILSIDYSVYDYFSKQTIFMQDPSNPTTLEISPPDMINIEIKSQQYVEFVDQIKIQCNSINSKTVQFFYYNSAEDREFELQNPYQTTRKLLSLDQTDQEVTTYLPSGDIIIMVLGFNEQIYQYSNITQVLTVNNNHFTQEQYIIFIQKQWSLAQQFKQQTQITKEIFIYQNMIEAIEQFEKKYQTTNQVIDQVKTDILLRLQESVWQNQIDQIFNLSGEITLRIVKTQIELDDSDMFNLIVSSTVNRIQKLCHSAQQISSYFNQKLKFQYQESFRITIQTYMALIKINEKMHQIDEESIIQNTFDAMTGMSQLLIINQSLVQLMTSSASVQVEKYDDVKFMNNYIQQQSNIDKDSFLNLNQFLVLTQTWPNNTSLYREELKQYNQKYLALANSTTLSQLLTTYSIKIPKVITINYRTNQDQRRRFLEDTKISNQQNNFVINFSNLTQNQNLECIQRNNKGKWVSSSCKTNIIIKNNQTQVDCICQIPDATSIIADAEALLQNENLSEIFSERGAVGVFKLQNWYEYIAIWTIIVLNIFYACLACVTRKFDKRDRAKLSNLQKQTDEEQNLFYQRSKKKEKVFIFIKARKSTFIKPQDYQQSENNSKEKSLLQEQKQNKSSDIKQIDLAEVKKIKIQDKAILSIQSLRHIENNQITSNQNVCQKPHSDKINTEKQTAPSLNIQNDSYFKQIQCNFTTKEDEQIKNQIEIHHQPGDEKQSLSQLLELKQENNQNNQQCEQRNQENIKEIQQSFQQQYHQQDARQSPKNKTQHNLADESFSQPQIKENQQQQNDIEKQSSEQIKYKDEKMKKEEKRKLKKAKKELAKQKMIEYLNQEKIIYGILSFHQLFSIFLIYYENQSRVLRSSIFYNKMVWLLTLNSIFGQNLTVAQIFILSIVSSIVLQIVTNIISLFLRYKNFQKIGVFFVFAFCLFCYYSILVTISRSSVYESNIWVISYFATLIINEFVFGIIKCIAQYFTCKKILQKTQSKYLLRMLGANLLLKSFSI
ncbi:hypothetical protein ABPG74_002757 [Tetrahymena malaccensis]